MPARLGLVVSDPVVVEERGGWEVLVASCMGESANWVSTLATR